ncbi:MAG: rhomboid family intramembrane serine protease [Candidatus Bathyarchaeia archaeon]
MDALGRDVITNVLVAVNIAVYAYASMLSGNPLVTDLTILIQFGQVNMLIVEGHWWQLVTSIFIHINLLHLVFNMIFLFIYGSRAEEALGEAVYLTVYIMSGLAGNITTLIFMGLNSPDVSAGASGAIFGILGAYMIHLGSRYDASVTPHLIYCFLFLMLNVSVNVNLAAHLGGLVTGMIAGYLTSKMEGRSGG